MRNILRVDLTTALVLAMSIALAGCQSLDRAPSTVQEGLYVSASYGEALALSVNDAYLNRNITKQQQTAALDNLQISKDAVQTGLDAFSVGNYNGAQAGLDRAEAILRSVALLLSRYGDD